MNKRIFLNTDPSSIRQYEGYNVSEDIFGHDAPHSAVFADYSPFMKETLYLLLENVVSLSFFLSSCVDECLHVVTMEIMRT